MATLFRLFFVVLSIVKLNVRSFVILEQNGILHENVVMEGNITLLQSVERTEPAEEQSIPGLTEGDIITDTKKEKRKFVRFDSWRWPGGVIPWKYSTDKRQFKKQLSRKYVDLAIRHMEMYTCVNFVNMVTQAEEYSIFRQIYKHNHYLEIGTGPGCASMVGYQKRPRQPITLHEQFCLQPGTMVHELGHSLGLFHEQSRTDRNNSIIVNWDHIQERTTMNFRMYDVITNFAPYDIQSIMHYGPKAFSKNGKNTIDARDPYLEFLMGQRSGLSFYDAKAINKAYKCSDKCKNDKLCQNDGFMVKQCKCLCPIGLTGEYCQDIDPDLSTDCGFIYELSDDIIEFESPNYPWTYNNAKCVWLIKAPPGGQVKLTVTIDELPREEKNNQCYHWLEIRYNLIGQAGPWICGKDARREIISTHGKIMLLFDGSNEKYTGIGFYLSAIVFNEQDNEETSNHVYPECNFDVDMCGFELDTDSTYAGWEITNRLLTGPFYDHTTGKGKFVGNFLVYVKPDLRARLISPTVDLTGARCLRFWFYAYGVSFGSLTLYIQQETKVNSLWSIEFRYLYRPWTMVAISLDNYGESHIIFEYVTGAHWGSYAIDDVIINSESCSS